MAAQVAPRCFFGALPTGATDARCDKQAEAKGSYYRADAHAVVATSLHELVHTVAGCRRWMRFSGRSRLRYQHDPQRDAKRHGSTQGDLALGGQQE